MKGEATVKLAPPAGSSPRASAATSATVTVSAATFSVPGPAPRRMRAASSTWTTPIFARGGEPPELLDDRLGFFRRVLDGARSVDDPEPHNREPEPVARRLDHQRLLAVDLRQVRKIGLLPVWGRRPDLARQAAAVDVQRRSEDE